MGEGYCSQQLMEDKEFTEKTIAAIVKLSEPVKLVVTELLCLSLFFGEKVRKNQTEFKKIKVDVILKDGAEFKTNFMNVDENSLVTTDGKGHIRLINMDFIKNLFIYNLENLRQEVNA